MGRFLKLTVMVLIVAACGVTGKSFAPAYDNVMYNRFDGNFTGVQLDSICTADTLDRNLANWTVVPFRDGETNGDIYLYMYIKSLGERECIYRLRIMGDDKYRITKRITE